MSRDNKDHNRYRNCVCKKDKCRPNVKREREREREREKQRERERKREREREREKERQRIRISIKRRKMRKMSSNVRRIGELMRIEAHTIVSTYIIIQ